MSMTFQLIILILIVFTAAFLLFKDRVIFRGRFRYVTEVKWMLSCYLFIILVATLVSYVLPQDELSYAQEDGFAQFEGEEYEFFYNIVEEARAGKLELLEELPKTGEWKLDFNGKQLELEKMDGDFHVSIIVEKTNKLQNSIQVIQYSNRTIIDGLDVTEKVEPLHVRLTGARLLVDAGEQQTLDITKFTKEMMIKQFTGKEKQRGSHAFIGAQILHVQIPEDMELIVQEGLDYDVVERE